MDQGEPWSTDAARGDKRRSTAGGTAGGVGAAKGAAAAAAAATAVGGGTGVSAGAAAAAGGGDPYLRVFAGSQSEGIVAVKWHEAMPPLPGLLVRVCRLRLE